MAVSLPWPTSADHASTISFERASRPERCHPAARGVELDGLGDVAGAQVGQGLAFGLVVLADVLLKCMDGSAVAFDQRAQRAAGPDRAQAGGRRRPGPPWPRRAGPRRSRKAMSRSVAMPASSSTTTWRGLSASRSWSSRQRNEARVLDSAMPASRPKVRAAWPEVAVPTTSYPPASKASPDRGHDGGLARSGHAHDQLDAPARSGRCDRRRRCLPSVKRTPRGAARESGRWRAARGAPWSPTAASLRPSWRATLSAMAVSAASTEAVE